MNIFCRLLSRLLVLFCRFYCLKFESIQMEEDESENEKERKSEKIKSVKQFVSAVAWMRSNKLVIYCLQSFYSSFRIYIYIY